MEYALEIDGTPETVAPGTGILLLHPSTAETDRIDTDFLKADTDRFLVVSTRTTAREVSQKLDYYDVDEDRADVLDTLSIERGYSRRSMDHVSYVSAPDHVDGILAGVADFLERTEGKRRLSFDSLTELAYYASDDDAIEAADRILELLDAHDAVGLFHLSSEVHDRETIDEFAARFDGVVDLAEDGSIEASF